MKVDLLLRNANLATMLAPSGYGEILDGALAVDERRIVWLGKTADIQSNLHPSREIDCEGQWLTPGLIDCHTHLVWAGNRANEFEQRLKGKTYAEIAEEGGGILSTVRATRSASAEQLVEASLPRIEALTAEGVTTVEIKSGYGLDIETELKCLEVAKRLNQGLSSRPSGASGGTEAAKLSSEALSSRPSGASGGTWLRGPAVNAEGHPYPNLVRILPTYLGAHAVPPEFLGRPDDYIEFICTEALPAIKRANAATAVDAFCETIAFSPAQCRRVLQRAKDLGFQVKLHADQLSDTGGAALIAELGGLSADHVEYTSEVSVRAMAKAGTVAVLLPGAFYQIRETKTPPVKLFREHGVPMAVATDCNPGTSPCTSLLLMLNMACVLFGLTPAEALAGVTRNAARALSLQDQIGTLAIGKQADLALFAIDHPRDLSAYISRNPITRRWFAGIGRPSSGP